MHIPKLSSGLNRTLSPSGKSQPHRIFIPGFNKEDIGLGNVIKKFTNKIGIETCGGCHRRAEAFNSWFVFSSKNRK